jgi:hypothetical protein
MLEHMKFSPNPLNSENGTIRFEKTGINFKRLRFLIMKCNFNSFIR